MAAFQDEWPAVVLAPCSLKGAWGEALAEWLGLGRGHVVSVDSVKELRSEGGISSKARIVLLHYDIVARPEVQAELNRHVPAHSTLLLVDLPSSHSPALGAPGWHQRWWFSTRRTGSRAAAPS